MRKNKELSFLLEEEVVKAAQSIKKGRVLLYPTGSIWGLGCDINNVSAVKRIYAIKHRPEDKPFALIVNSIGMLKQYIHEIHPRVETLLMHHLQPLTIIYRGGENLPSHLGASDRTIAIRVTHDEFCCKLIDALKQPLVTTSANISGDGHPSSFSDIGLRVKEMVDDIVDDRLESKGQQLPSILATYDHKGDLDFLRL